jgi:hypothetical protein
MEQSGAEADKLNTYEMLEDALREEYKKQYKSNNNQHFTSQKNLGNFLKTG